MSCKSRKRKYLDSTLVSTPIRTHRAGTLFGTRCALVPPQKRVLAEELIQLDYNEEEASVGQVFVPGIYRALDQLPKACHRVVHLQTADSVGSFSKPMSESTASVQTRVRTLSSWQWTDPTIRQYKRASQNIPIKNRGQASQILSGRIETVPVGLQQQLPRKPQACNWKQRVGNSTTRGSRGGCIYFDYRTTRAKEDRH